MITQLVAQIPCFDMLFRLLFARIIETFNGTMVCLPVTVLIIEIGVECAGIVFA
jgi:hypothetical protein